MKNRTFHLAVLMTIGILASAMAVAAQPSSWAVGTFTGQDPNTGDRVRLVIEKNGDVAARIEGNTDYGTIKKDRMTINGETIKLKKTRSGFRATNNSSRQVIEYVRGNSGWNDGNNDWDDNYQGGGRRVPDWAIGTFTGTKPNTGVAIKLRIESGGSVHINMKGSYLEGSISRETITINGETLRVRRESNGISTINRSNGETIYYTRSGESGYTDR